MTNRFSQMGNDFEQEHRDGIADIKDKEGDDDAWVEDELKKGMLKAHEEVGGTSEYDESVDSRKQTEE